MPYVTDLLNRVPDVPQTNGVDVYHTYVVLPPGGPWEARFVAGAGAGYVAGGPGITMVTSAVITSVGTVGPNPTLTLQINGVGRGGDNVTVASGATLHVQVGGDPTQGALHLTDTVTLQQVVPGAPGTRQVYLTGTTTPPPTVPGLPVTFTMTAPTLDGEYDGILSVTDGGIPPTLTPFYGPHLVVGSGSIPPGGRG